MKKLLLASLLFILLNCSLFAQVADVPMIWDEGTGCITSYHMYHSALTGGPYLEIGVIMVVDSEGVRLPGFTPTFTDVNRDFTVDDAHYVVTAMCVPGLESAFSNELKVAAPSVGGRLKINRN